MRLSPSSTSRVASGKAVSAHAGSHPCGVHNTCFEVCSAQPLPVKTTGVLFITPSKRCKSLSGSAADGVMLRL